MRGSWTNGVVAGLFAGSSPFAGDKAKTLQIVTEPTRNVESLVIRSSANR
jgi:hypothetical protein